MHDHHTADIEEEVKYSDHDTADREEEVKDSDHDTADREEEVKDSDQDTADREEELKDSDQDTADREEETKIKTQLFGLKSIEMQIIFIASYHSFQSTLLQVFPNQFKDTSLQCFYSQFYTMRSKSPLTVALFVGKLVNLTIQSYILKYFIDTIKHQRSMK